MSIWIFTNGLRVTNGLYKSVNETANLLSKNGYNVKMICMVNLILNHYTPNELDENIEFYMLKKMTLNNEGYDYLRNELAVNINLENFKIKYTKYEMELLRELSNSMSIKDFIIFTHPVQSYLFEKAKIIPKCKTMLQIHGNYNELDIKDIFIESSNKINYLQVVSKGLKDDLKKIIQINDENIKYIPNLHVPDKISKKSSKKFRVAIIGSMIERKNQLDAILAIKEIKDSNIVLKIWGFEMGEYYLKLKEYVEENDLSEKVEFCGFGTENEIYSNTDLIVMTSLSEGFGYIMIEAASHKIPSVVYDFKHGPRDVIDNGINGYIVKEGSYSKMAEHIIELYTDKEKYKQFGERIYLKYRENFSLDSILKEYRKLGLNNYINKLVFKNSKFEIENIIINQKESFFKYNYYFEFDLVSEFENFNIILYKNRKETNIEFKRQGNKIIGTVELQKYSKKSLIKLKKFKSFSSTVFLKQNNKCYYIFGITKAGKHEVIMNYINHKERDIFIKDFNLCIETDAKKLDYIKSFKNKNIQYTIKKSSRNRLYRDYIHLFDEFDKINLNGESLKIFKNNLTYLEIYNKINSLQIDENERFYKDIDIWEISCVDMINSVMFGMGLWSSYSKGTLISTKNISKDIIDLSRIKSKNATLFTIRNNDYINNYLINEIDENYLIVASNDLGENFYNYKDDYEEFIKDLKIHIEYDSNYFNDLFTELFGIRFELRSRIKSRIRKFILEYKFWNNYFRQNKHITTIYCPTLYFVPGIVKAAKDNNVKVIDIQYALLYDLHPIYSFMKRDRLYSPDKIIVWTNYWKVNSISNIKDIEVMKKTYLAKFKEENKNYLLDKNNIEYDFLFASQGRIGQRMFNLLVEYIKSNPLKKIVYCPHPSEVYTEYEGYEYISNNINVLINTKKRTLDMILKSKKVVGVFSTTLYEAAYLEKMVYVLNVPSWDMMSRPINERIMKFADNINDINKDYKIDKKLISSLF